MAAIGSSAHLEQANLSANAAESVYISPGTRLIEEYMQNRFKLDDGYHATEQVGYKPVSYAAES